MYGLKYQPAAIHRKRDGMQRLSLHLRISLHSHTAGIEHKGIWLELIKGNEPMRSEDSA